MHRQTYALTVLAPILYVGWKLIKRTKRVKSVEADLVWERPVIDAYEATFTAPPIGFWTEMGQMVGIGRKKKDNVRNMSVVENYGLPQKE